MNEFEKCWLNYNRADIVPEYIKQIDTVICESNSHIAENAVNEVCIAMKDIYGIEINRASSDKTNGSIILKIFDENDQKYAGTFTPDKEGYVIYFVKALF